MEKLLETVNYDRPEETYKPRLPKNFYIERQLVLASSTFYHNPSTT